MSDFDKEDDRAKYVVPKSANDGKVVKLSEKTLTTKKQVRKILPEEKYISKLDKIIEKDYFPELKKLKAQKEYIEAVAAKDVTKIRELQIKFCSGSSIRTDGSLRIPMTFPSTFGESSKEPSTSRNDDGQFSPSVDSETPGTSYTNKNNWINTPIPFANQEGDNEALARKKRKKQELSITTYLNNFTSEDNASFEELTKVMREREDAKRKWMYKAEEEHNKNLIERHAIAAEADVQLALKHATDSDEARPLNIDNWKYTAWNTVLFNPDGAKLTAVEAAEAAKRQQIVINRKGTRFPENINIKPSEEARTRAAQSHAIQNVGKVDVCGHEVGIEHSMKLMATPNPDPGSMDSPFMTWGEIDGTPFRLDVPDVAESTLGGSVPSFKIPDVPFREKIAQSMHDNFASKYRDKRKIAMKAAEEAHHTPKFGSSHRISSKISHLSPAAQKLATKKLGLKVSSSKSPFLSPNVKSSNSWSRTPGTSWSRGSTPGSSWSQGAKTPGTPSIEDMIKRKDEKSKSKTKKDDSSNKEESEASSSNSQSRAKAGDFF